MSPKSSFSQLLELHQGYLMEMFLHNGIEKDLKLSSIDQWILSSQFDNVFLISHISEKRAKV